VRDLLLNDADFFGSSHRQELEVKRMKHVSVDHAAETIGVSSATIRNWAKAGHIVPTFSRPIMFSEESVLSLKNKIQTDSFGKLKTRANKSASANSFLPEEYAGNAELASKIASVVAYVKHERLEVEVVIFLAALRLLELRGEVVKTISSNPFDLSSYSSWLRDSVKSVIYDWRSSLQVSTNDDRYVHAYKIISSSEGDDYLGLLYQSIVNEGSKSEQGSYYTPSRLVEDSLSHISGIVRTFLDPCCGSGKYLLIAAKKFKLLPKNIFGFDCDRTAINIAKINILLAFEDSDFLPNIYCIDSLSELATGEMFCETNNLIGQIDAIATNPPWGAYKNAARKSQFSGNVKSGETFSLFLEKSINLLRMGGGLSFILPESILKIRVHADIREIILNNTKILNIASLGRQFTGVFTPVIRLDLEKQSPTDEWLASVETNNNKTLILQSRFKKNDNFTFDVSMGSHEERLLNKIYSIAHTTLVNKCEWALGIVTGDNKKFILQIKRVGAEAVYRGGDVFQYLLGEPKSFIYFTPNAFQQVAPEKYFRAPEKLIYKFISKKLVFAYDDKQQLTLNSANILIPAIPEISIKVALAFLNSSVFQYIFTKKFSTHKILRGDLEKLPFPLLGQKAHSDIERIVDDAIVGRGQPRELDEYIFNAFGLSHEDISVIKKSVEG
jgi:adenine-specific DNA methylase